VAVGVLLEKNADACEAWGEVRRQRRSRRRRR
jgi:hypothetical protein